MPNNFNGKSGGYAEFVFKMEAYMSTLDPSGKGREVLRAAVFDPRDLDQEEVKSLEPIYWNVPALNATLASRLITTNTGEAGTLVRRFLSGLRAWQELNRLYLPKSTVEGTSSMTRIIEPPKSKSVPLLMHKR